jgi:hypothetical protein
MSSCLGKVLVFAALFTACRRVELLTSDVAPGDLDGCVARWRGEALASSIDDAAAATMLRERCAGLTCAGPCVRCIDDADCGDARLCVSGSCGACPGVSGCAVPEGGLVRLVRNGCATCDFAPRSECDDDAGCKTGVCYRGAACAAGCTRAECCANVCAAEGCPAPTPLGCLAPCPSTATSALCRAARCACVGGDWRCDIVETSHWQPCAYTP